MEAFMRILHTADWHLGKSIGEIPLIEDQRDFLLRLCDLAQEKGVDVVVIAGDIYQRAVPPAEAVVLLDEIWHLLVRQMGIPVIAIAGNHDSPERMAFGAGLYESSGLYVAGTPQLPVRRVKLKDAYGDVIFHLIPHYEPAYVRGLVGDDNIRTHQDAFKALLKGSGTLDPEVRHIAVAHGFFGQGTDDSQEKMVGGSAWVSADLLADYDYAALGHLHEAKAVDGLDRVRYAGSILKYSVSEAMQNKSVTLVEIGQKGEVSIQEIHLPPRHDLRVLSGPLERLLEVGRDREDRFDYVYVRLADDMAYDAMSRLRAVFPNAVNVQLAAEYETELLELSGASSVEGKDMRELFKEFFMEATGETLTGEQAHVMEQLFAEIEKREAQ